MALECHLTDLFTMTLHLHRADHCDLHNPCTLGTSFLQDITQHYSPQSIARPTPVHFRDIQLILENLKPHRSLENHKSLKNYQK